MFYIDNLNLAESKMDSKGSEIFCTACGKRWNLKEDGNLVALVQLDGEPFKYFAAHRDEWAVETCFVYPGAIQYWGPAEVCDQTTVTLALEMYADGTEKFVSEHPSRF